MGFKPIFCLLLVWLFAGTVHLRAQDPSFSQVFAMPTYLNPALTGLFAGRYRAVIAHRSQWADVMPSPFSTTAFSADFGYRFDAKRRTSDAFGGGILFLNDRVATGSVASNSMLVNGAYHKNLDGRGLEHLSLGVQLGIVQRSLGYGDLSFEDEFDGTSVFLSGTGGEVLPESSVSFGDYHLGLNYSRNPERGTGLTAGVALHHLTRPEQSFYAGSPVAGDQTVTNTLYARLSGYLSLRMPVAPNLQLLPRIYGLVQGPHAMVLAGSHLRIAAAGTDRTAFQLGALLRGAQEQDGPTATGVIGFVGMEVGDFLFGFSYDGGISGEGNVGNRHRATFELSASYIGLADDDAAVPCPKF